MTLSKIKAYTINKKYSIVYLHQKKLTSFKNTLLLNEGMIKGLNFTFWTTSYKSLPYEKNLHLISRSWKQQKTFL